MIGIRKAVLAFDQVPFWESYISIIVAVPFLKVFADDSDMSMVLKGAVNVQKRLKLSRLLSDFARFQATDSRDKISICCAGFDD